jgi:hypothetical protein
MKGDREKHAGLLTLARSIVLAAVWVVAYYLLPLNRSFTVGTVIALVAGLAAATGVFVWQLRSIARSPYPNLRAIGVLASTTPFFLLLFAACYFLMEHANAKSFNQALNKTDALYFTITVFTTVGFGDIVPLVTASRLLTTMQMVLDVLLIGVAARFVVEAIQEGLRARGGSAPDGEPGAGGP